MWSKALWWATNKSYPRESGEQSDYKIIILLDRWELIKVLYHKHCPHTLAALDVTNKVRKKGRSSRLPLPLFRPSLTILRVGRRALVFAYQSVSKTSFKYQTRSPALCKVFTNCFIKPNLISRGGKNTFLDLHYHILWSCISILSCRSFFFILYWCLAQLSHSHEKQAILVQPLFLLNRAKF